jgi:anti-sigma B factor antagonist
VSLLELRTAVAKGDDGVLVITLEGDLDMAAAPIVGECVATVLDAGATTIALALGGVRFVDSSGLAALVEAQRATVAADRTLVLRSVPRRVHDLLLMTGLDRTFRTE